jgi:dipeptidyl aminopeptidase/acylaminoacyl peptidase
MKYLFIFAFALLEIGTLFAQNKEIDINAINNQVRLGDYNISKDGKYIWYAETSEASGVKLNVCDNEGKKRACFPEANKATFTANSKYLVFNRNDGISVLKLSAMKVLWTGQAENAKVAGDGPKTYIGYNTGDTFKLKNLLNGEEKSYSGIKGSYFNGQGTGLVLQKDTGLIWIDLIQLKEKAFFTGTEIRNVNFSPDGLHLIFSSTRKNGTTIYEYDPQMQSAAVLVDKYSEGIQTHLEILNDNIRFSNDGRFVFFQLKELKASLRPENNLITKDVSVWSFRDKELQSEQMNSRYLVKEYMAVVSPGTRRVIQLETEHQSILGQPGGEYILLKNNTHELEIYWNGENLKYWLVSLRTGQQKDFMPSAVQQPILVALSSNGQYITWRDERTNETFCYSTKTNAPNIIDSTIIGDGPIGIDGRKNSFEVSGWLKDDAALIGYDSFDVWQIDPENKKKPISITGGFGRKNGIQFRPLDVLKPYALTGINDSILLTGMEVSTKYNGFTKAALSAVNNLDTRFLGPYLYYLPDITLDLYVPPPLKADRSTAFLVQRQSDTSPSNIYFTRDFSRFIAISDVKPIEGYRGYSAVLIKWTQKNGEQRFGILYKPQSLDTAISYPIIFNYYEGRSFERYQYKVPALGPANVNIPWYVSRDYVIFIPDIYRVRGKTGQAALETVESAAEYITEKYKWINKNKMGLQGHSHGGYLTNYIATHSRLFTAAQSSAGYSDFVSGYGLLAPGVASMQVIHEVGQINLGVTPFQNAQVYIDNSCIFTVDKVTSPLLLMHNQRDVSVSFGQSLELFTALRRANKPAWLLEYDNEGHVLAELDHILDFCIRQQQFFDHYLKGKPAPEWMTKGVPARYKGLKSGLKLDTLNIASLPEQAQ